MAAHPPSSPASHLWLFRLDGMVYGPVSDELVVEKIESGAIDTETMIAREGGAFTRVADQPAFDTLAARVAARRRVEALVRAEAAARTRRRITWVASLVVGAVLLAVGAVRLVDWVEEANLFGPDTEALAALEIRSSHEAVHIAIAPSRDQAADEEYLAYIDEGGDEGKRRTRRRTAGKTTASTSTAAAAAKAPAAGTRTAPAAAYDQGSIREAIARQKSTLHGCLQERARADATFRGEVPFTFTIGNDGRVGRVGIDRPGLGELQACFERTMAGWRFPAFTGERPSVSLSFHVGG